MFSLITETILGLEVLHSHQIVHRDLKSLNLLVTSDWHVKVTCVFFFFFFHYFLPDIFRQLCSVLFYSPIVPQVCDFGLSRFDNGQNEETLHQLRGTMAFCAPEVYYSSKFTFKSDIYSLTVVLWELCVRVIKGAERRSAH
jgi:serine/threonine protein kinase